MNIDENNPKSPSRDRLVLSKGHVAPALYSVLAEKGYFNISQDGGHTFESIPCEEIFNGGNRVVSPEKTGEDRQKKTVTYQWIDLYTKEVITKAEYDLKMNFIRNVN